MRWIIFLQISILSNPENIHFVRERFLSFFRYFLNEDQKFEITLCLDEALSNIIVHAYKGIVKKKISLWIQYIKNHKKRKSYLKIQIFYDYGYIPIRDIQEALNQKNKKLVVGKKGIFIINSYMDFVRFFHHKNNQTLFNVMLMIKKI